MSEDIRIYELNLKNDSLHVLGAAKRSQRNAIISFQAAEEVDAQKAESKDGESTSRTTARRPETITAIDSIAACQKKTRGS